MAQFITPAQAISKAFDRTISADKVVDGLIESIQETHIRELLGNDLYELVLADATDKATYETLIDTYLAPIIAQWVKYYILPDVYYEIGGAGISKIPGQGRTAAPVEEVANIRQSVQEKIELFIKRMIQYLEDNEDETKFSEYSSFNVSRRIETVGGFMFELSPDDIADLDDDDNEY